MPNLLKEVVVLGGILRVVWIDDLFDNNVNQVANEIAIKIPALLKSGHTLEDPTLSRTKWNANAGSETFLREVQAIVDGDKFLALEILENVAAQQSREDPDAPPIVADLSTAQVELIKAVFGKDKVATFGFEEWARIKRTSSAPVTIPYYFSSIAISATKFRIAATRDSRF